MLVKIRQINNQPSLYRAIPVLKVEFDDIILILTIAGVTVAKIPISV